MKKLVVLLCSLALFAVMLTGCGNSNGGGTDSGVLVVGATAKPHAEILEVVKPLLAAEGVELDIEEFTDYVLLNPALKDKRVDANFFQHIPYLDDYNEKNNDTLVWVAKVHNEPMGVYSQQIDSLEQLAD